MHGVGRLAPSVAHTPRRPPHLARPYFRGLTLGAAAVATPSPSSAAYSG